MGIRQNNCHNPGLKTLGFQILRLVEHAESLLTGHSLTSSAEIERETIK